MRFFEHDAGRMPGTAMNDAAAQTTSLSSSSGSEGAACAIVGLAIRLPGGNDSPLAFWRYLQSGAYRVDSLAEQRFAWPAFIDPSGAHAGIDRAFLIDDVASQDMAFFGVSAKEAEMMDPQQRILLELSWEAFESAGIRPSSLSGTTTGVFVGASHSDYRELAGREALTPEAYLGTGSPLCILSNRLSYFFNFKGPSYTVDAACSASLFAVAEGANAIARGDCEHALVGAVNLILTSTASIAYYQAGTLSSTATCNPFDDSSDGYIRAEGAAMMVLKSLDKARRDGDQILGIVRGAAINHCGKGRTLTAPSALSQAQVVASAFEKAGMPVDRVNYIETHGTGTPVGDPIEIAGLGRALGRLAKRQGIELPAGHVALGALKARLGHAEPAAGVGAIAKVLLALRHRRLPANPRLDAINRRIELDGTPLRLLRGEEAWRAPVGDPETGPLCAGISSFGFGGTNAHLLIESGDPLPEPVDEDGGIWPFGLSTRSAERLEAYARSYLHWLAQPETAGIRLRDLSRTMLAGREAMDHRVAFAAVSTEGLRDLLQAFVDGRDAPGLHRGPGAAAAPAAASDDADREGADREDADAESLARRWARGENPDFGVFHEGARPLLYAPTYPFDRKPHWLPWPGARLGHRGEASAAPAASAVPPRAAAATVSTNVSAPSSAEALRTALIAMVAALCRVDAKQVDPAHKFVDSGVDSILAVGLIRQINAHWNTRLSPATLYDHSSIDMLARHLQTLVVVADADADVDADVARPGDVAGIAPPASGVATVDELLPALLRMVAEELRTAPASIDPDARFADYGVDSIIVVGLTRQLNAAWRQHLKPIALFEQNTLRRLATHLAGRVDRALVAGALVEEASVAAGAASAASARAAAVPSAAVSAPVPASNGAGRGHRAVVLREPTHLADVGASGIADPLPGDEDVVVAVRAFSLNFGDLLCVGGFYPDMPEYPFTPGFEASGVVVAVGPAVRGIAVGDPVVTIAGRELGAHATRVQSHCSRVFPIPQGLDFVDACALPVVAMTALDAFGKAKPQAGESVLIHSAAGGVGLAAVQLARHMGLEIYATVGSESKFEVLRALGVHRLINYRERDFEREIMAMTDGRGVDIVLNTLPGDALQKGLNLLAPSGRYVEMAMAALKSATSVDLSSLSDNQAFFAVNLRKSGLKQPARMRDLYERMAGLATQGVFRAVVGRTYSFDRYREALEHLASRESIGKIVVTIPAEMLYDAGAPSATTFAAARAEPASAPQHSRETDIAVIGMSGRFAGSDDLDALWTHLAQGDDLVGPVTRWDLSAHHADGRPYCGSGSFLDRIDAFDPVFFGIAGVEARYMDPQQRLLLEESWHALEDAGYASDRASEGICGVYVGCAEGDYHRLFGDEGIPAQAFWGNATSLVPARIAYHLDLRGPAVAIDTACSSSLVAVHQACQALWLGEIDMALAGGVFVQATPRLYVSAERAEMLSHRGHCHAFGAGADGFVPGEGVGAIVLKRLSRALADGDHVHAVIRGSGVGQDGATNGITAPSGQAQHQLECGIYRRFGIDPAEMRMIEAHGTGTVLGDPIEFDALTRSFSEFTDRRGFCAIGSIKSNVGHLATAAGIAGLLKVLLSVRHGSIPPTLHGRPGNPYLDVDASPFYLSDRLHAWPDAPGGRRLAAVSSFGFSGTNAHVVVESPPHSATASPARPAHLVALSAQSPEQLHEVGARLLRRLRTGPVDCGHLAHTLLVGRKHFGHRFACVAADVGELAERLDAWLAGRDPEATAGHAARDAAGAMAAREAAAACLARCARADDHGRYRADLRTLAALYRQGCDFDARPLFSERGFRTIPLPGYPFARNRYWVPEARPAAASAAGVGLRAHPLVHDNRSSLGRQRYRSVFAGDEAFFIDHRVHGRPLLSGAAQLEMAVVAAASALDAPIDAVSLEDVLWLRPLVAEGRTEVWIALVPDGADAVRYEILGPVAGIETIYGTGRARRVEADAARADDIAAPAAATDAHVFDAAACYAAYRRRGIEYGPSHRGLAEVRVPAGGDEVAAAIALPYAQQAARFHWPPGLLDSALQASIGFDLAEGGEDRPPLVPYALARFIRYRAPTPDLRVSIRRRRTGTGAMFDLDLRDMDGRLCLRLEGLEARPMLALAVPSKTASRTDGTHAAGARLDEARPDEARPDQAIHLRPMWRPADPEPQLRPSSAAGTLLAIGLDAETAGLWRRAVPGFVDAGIDPDDDADVLRAKLAAHGRFDRLLIAFPDPGSGPVHDEPGDALLDRHDRGVRRFFRTIKALLALGHDAHALDLTIATVRGQALDQADPPDPALASIHGLAGSLAKEYPQWSLRVLDLDALSAWAPQTLLSIPADAMGNAWLGRAGRWYRQALVHCELPEADAPVYRSGGVYVILGGAGGIGEAYSEHLIRRHGARIVWLGRRAEDDALRARLDRLAALGDRPLYLAVDATDPAALAEARARILAVHGAIHGVVHSALVLEDATLAQMDEGALFRALDAKTRTSVRLAEVFGGDALDFMLFFSSANSFVRAPGQANYVAGCLFKDALAQRLAGAVDYPVKIVNWGYWGSVGAVANEDIARRVAVYGLSSIDPAQALAMIERLLAAPCGQLAYLAAHRAISALGLPVAADLAWRAASVAAGATDAVPALMRAFGEPAPLARDDIHARIEARALPLLWHRILASGLLAAGPDAETPARYRIVGEGGRQARWLRESLARLDAAGAIAIADDGSVVATLAEDAATAEARWSALRAEADGSDSRGWLVAIDTTLGALPDILAERRFATEVLFPESSMDLVEGMYKRDPAVAAFNDALGALVAAHARRAGADGLRLIEIGAGTGASTERILARLKSEGLRPAEYVYTDVSKAFLFHAETRYGAEADFLRYDLLDIEAPVPAGSPHTGRYDVAIAANVLHATGDIVATLRNAKALLRRGGLLLINEIAENNLMLHLTFGLLDGWWLQRDSGLRAPGGPALSPEGWRRALAAAGFAPVAWPMAPLHRLGYQIVVAQSDGGILTARASSVSVPPPPAAGADAGPDTQARVAAWLAADRAAATQALRSHLRGIAGAILGLREDELDAPSRPFADAMLGALGMDSLLASNLRNQLLKELEVDIPVQVLIGEPVAAVVDQVYQQLLLRQLSASPGDRQVDGDFETLVF